MTQVTVNGNTYSDAGESAKDMRDGGHRTHLLPMVGDVMVAINAASLSGNSVVTVTGTGAQSVTNTQGTIVWAPSTPADVTFTLPASPSLGQTHAFKYRIITGTQYKMTINPSAGTIDNLSSIVLSTYFAEVTLRYTATNPWTVVSAVVEYYTASGMPLSLTRATSTQFAVVGLSLRALDSGNAPQEYSRIESRIWTNTAGSEDGTLGFYTTQAGVETEQARLYHNGGLSLGSGYVGTLPPADGAIIEGSVGIGMTSAPAGLSVGVGKSIRDYNSFTDASNGEWAEFFFSSNVLHIGTNQNGTGTARNLRFNIGGTNRLDYGVTNAATWTAAASFIVNGSLRANGGATTTGLTDSGGNVILQNTDTTVNNWTRIQFLDSGGDMLGMIGVQNIDHTNNEGGFAIGVRGDGQSIAGTRLDYNISNTNAWTFGVGAKITTNTGATEGAVFNVDAQAGNATAAKFGSNLPVYLMTAQPVVGLNTYWNGTSWVFGKGSVSGTNYAGYHTFVTTTGMHALAATTATGNADAAATLQNVFVVDRNGMVSLGPAAAFTASFPALKRSSTTLQTRLGDDSAYAAFEASDLSTKNVVSSLGLGTDSAGKLVSLAQRVRSTADFTANSGSTGTTLTNVTGLSVSLAAGGKYIIRGVLFVSSTANGGAKIALSNGDTLTATAIRWAATILGAANGGATVTNNALGATVAATAAVAVINFSGVIEVNAAGTLVVQAAQNTSHADTTTVFTNSFLEVVKIG